MDGSPVVAKRIEDWMKIIHAMAASSSSSSSS